MSGVEQFVPGGTAAQCWFEFKYTSTGRKKSWPNEASKIRRRYALNKRHRSWYTFSQQQYHHIVESIFISMRVLQPAHNTPIRLGHSEFRKDQSKKLWVQIQIQFWLEYLVHFGCDTSKSPASTYKARPIWNSEKRSTVLIESNCASANSVLAEVVKSRQAK